MADREDLRRLAFWIGRYGIMRNAYGLVAESPSRHLLRCYGLWVDISGVGHLYGGEAALLADMTGRLEQLGLTARVGLADTLGAAHALAWHGRPSGIAEPGETLQSIAHLPVAALRLDRALVHLLQRLGFRDIGALARIARAALERRFRSPEESGRVLHRLDQALGNRAEPRRPLVEPAVLGVQQSFAEPLITAQTLETAIEALVAVFCAKLDAAGVGVQAARVVFYRCDGTAGEVAIALSRATRAQGHLLQLLGEKLGGLDLGFGVDLVSIDALRIEKTAFIQQSLTDGSARMKSARGAELVDRLVNRLGNGHLYRLQPQASHLPERSQRRSQVLAVSPEPDPSSNRPEGHVVSVRRPALLLATPEPIAVIAEIPEGAPRRLIWRRVTYAITRAQGPERIEAEWWRQLWPHPGGRSRDYYTLEDAAGARFWVFREGRYDDEADENAPTWFVHGVFA